MKKSNHKTAALNMRIEQELKTKLKETSVKWGMPQSVIVCEGIKRQLTFLDTIKKFKKAM